MSKLPMINLKGRGSYEANGGLEGLFEDTTGLDLLAVLLVAAAPAPARERRQFELAKQLTVEAEVGLFLNFARPVHGAHHFGVTLLQVRRAHSLAHDACLHD